MNSLEQTAKAIAVWLLATLCVVALGTVLIVALDFVLLIFLGVLFSVFLTKISQFLNRFIPIGYRWNLALVTSLLLLIVGGGFTLLGGQIQDRVQATSKRLDEGTDKLVQRLREHPMMFNAFERIPFARELVLDEQSKGTPELQPTDSKQEKSEQPQSEQPGSEQEDSTQPIQGPAESSKVNDKLEAYPTSTQPIQGPAESSKVNDKLEAYPTSTQPIQGHAESSKVNDKLEAYPTSTQSSQGVAESSKEGVSESSGDTAKFVRTSAGKVFAILGQLLSTSLGLVANVGLIFFVGIFIAVDPTLYRDGFARLFPLQRRSRVADILDRIGSTMFSWLMGRFLAMLITGVGTAVALLLLGVPMAVTVGVITGLLTFVPNIGAIVGLVLAILMALPQGVATVFWVVGLYAFLQLLESNVITPLVQQHQTSIPPALLLSFQVIMGAVAGFLGLMVATPLLAASLVLIEQAWIKDVLGEPAGEN